MAKAQIKANFIEPMLLLRIDRLPEGPNWLYEIKLDGYRAVAARSDGCIHLWSRNGKDFGSRYPTIKNALANLSEDTVVDGEIVALDNSGKPSFNALQNYGASKPPLAYYLFDVPVLGGRDLRDEPLELRRKLLEEQVMPLLSDPIRLSPEFPASLDQLINSVRAQGLEGLVAKKRNSRYEAGQRSGAWTKMRVNEGQEFVIAGYTIGGRTFDAVVFGHYDGPGLFYVARTRNGFTPQLRDSLMRRFKGLEVDTCPFVNLPEKRSGRWGEGLTAEKMDACRWLKPVLVGQFEFLEWTEDGHLRHVKFIGLREDRTATDVCREDTRGD